MNVHKINDTVEDILKSTRRGSVFGRNTSAIDDGYKIFIQSRDNLSNVEIDEIFIILKDYGIEGEIVINGHQMASWCTLCFLVWKIK